VENGAVLIPGLTFVLVLTIMLGFYWSFVVRPEHASGTALRKRLGRNITALKDTARVEREESRMSGVPVLNHLLVSRAHLVQPVTRLIEQSGVETTVGVVLLGTGSLVMLGVLIGQSLAGTLWVGLILGCCLAVLPFAFLNWKRNKRVQRFEELFPEALDLMARAMRAGHTFITAIGMVADELPTPIGPEFKILHDQQNFGMPLNDALREFGERVPLLTAKFFVTAILTQRESGGNLTEVLDNLAAVIRDRFNVMRQVKVRAAHGKITGWTLVALPPALALVLAIISPSHFVPMLHSTLGMQMIVSAVVLQIAGALIIRKIVNIEY
jgi:tight adherence protein B